MALPWHTNELVHLLSLGGTFYSSFKARRDKPGRSCHETVFHACLIGDCCHKAISHLTV